MVAGFLFRLFLFSSENIFTQPLNLDIKRINHILRLPLFKLERKIIINIPLKNVKPPLLLFLLFIVLYIAPLGLRPLFVPDETRYAEVPREMISSSDWCAPKLDGLRYFEKPVLGYWLNALSIMLLGENAFAVRLSSALAAGLAALLIYLLARKYDKDSPPWLPSLIFLTFAEVYALGTFSVLDSLFSLFITAGLVAYYFAADRNSSIAGRCCFLALFGIACGLAFLTKGFLAFAVPAVVVAPFMLWEKRWKELFLYHPWIPILFAVLTVLPWGIAVYHKEPDFWNYFFYEEHVKRFFSADGPKHPEPPVFFIPVIIAGALPWTFASVASFMGFRKGFLKDSFTRYLICWLVIPFLFFSASRGKLATYILPCFPPLAILLAMGLRAYFAQGWRKAFDRSLMPFGILLALLIPGLLIARIWNFPYGKGENLSLVLALLAVAFWSLMVYLAMKSADATRKMLFFAAGPLLVMFLSHVAVPDFLVARKAPGALLARNASRVKPDTPLVAYSSLAGAAAWYFKRDDIYILHKEGEFRYGLQYADAKNRFLSFKDFENFIKLHPGTVLIMEHKDKRDEFIPEGKFEDSASEIYFIAF